MAQKEDVARWPLQGVARCRVPLPTAPITLLRLTPSNLHMAVDEHPALRRGGVRMATHLEFLENAPLRDHAQLPQAVVAKHILSASHNSHIIA